MNSLKWTREDDIDTACRVHNFEDIISLAEKKVSYADLVKISKSILCIRFQFCHKHYGSLLRVFELESKRTSKILATRQLRENVGGKLSQLESLMSSFNQENLNYVS